MLYHSILICQTPAGDPPLVVRQAWEGLIILGQPVRSGISLSGVVTNQDAGQTKSGDYKVWAFHAVDKLLKRGRPEDLSAAKWWIERAICHSALYFNAACCRRVEGDVEISRETLEEEYQIFTATLALALTSRK